jgi:hypothetical protein
MIAQGASAGSPECVRASGSYYFHVFSALFLLPDRLHELSFSPISPDKQMSDYVRILQNDKSLTLILKKTHFTGLEGVSVQCSVVHELPVLIVKFPEPAQNFLMILSLFELGDRAGWIEQRQLMVVLEISDTVIADCVSKEAFVFSEMETRAVIDAFYAQGMLSTTSLTEFTENIIAQQYRYL